MAEVAMLRSGGIYTGLKEGMTKGVGQSATSALKMETVCLSKTQTFYLQVYTAPKRRRRIKHI
jgi:hypothetical protein